MKRSHFAPDDFEITEDRLKWAMETFGITKKEVERQTDEWHDYEYKRAYSDWNRAWKRWFRQADKFGTLHRERVVRKPQEVSDEERQADLLKWERDMERLGVSPLSAASAGRKAR